VKNPFTLKLQAGLLLAGELILLLTSALWDDLDPSTKWPAWLYIILFAGGGYALARNRTWLIAYLLTSATALLLGFFERSAPFLVISTLCFSVAYLLLFHVVIQHCFFHHEVAATDRILGGIAGYLLIGFFWNSQSNWAQILNPEAFFNQLTEAAATEPEMLYYSFVTLTSLGYGDIVPTTAVARLIAIFNCLSGVLYLAIFISALIGGLRKQAPPAGRE